MIAGEMMGKMGARKTFAVFSGCSIITMVLYFTYVNAVVPAVIKSRRNTAELEMDSLSSSRMEGEQLLASNSDSDDSETSVSSEEDTLFEQPTTNGPTDPWLRHAVK